MTAWHTSAAPFPADHPCLPGHFPDKPIVPGTMILERVVDSLTERHKDLRVCEVVSAKFLSPLQPEQAFTIHYTEDAEGVGFECRLEETILTIGRLKWTRRVLPS